MSKQLPKGIRMRGAKYFVDVTVSGNRHTATCETLEEAVATRLRLRGAMQVGLDPRTPRANAKGWTLQEALDKVLSLPKPEGWRGCSYENIARMNVESAIEIMGPDVPLVSIDRDMIDRWLAACEAKGNSDSTINRKISALSKVLKTAVAFGGLAAMPHMPKLRKEAVGRIRQISEAEERTMLDTFVRLGMIEQAAAVTVLIDTGLRCSELWNVRAEDVDLKSGIVLVYGVEGKGTKNGKYRSVPMTKRVKQIMGRRAGQPQPFPYDNTWLRHPWDRVRGMMGLSGDKNYVPHVCRHTCASRLVKAGVSLPVVKDWLGHASITTTMKYSHLMPQDLLRAVAALEGDAA
jgi:integrase